MEAEDSELADDWISGPFDGKDVDGNRESWGFWSPTWALLEKWAPPRLPQPGHWTRGGAATRVLGGFVERGESPLESAPFV